MRIYIYLARSSAYAWAALRSPKTRARSLAGCLGASIEAQLPFIWNPPEVSSSSKKKEGIGSSFACGAFSNRAPAKKTLLSAGEEGFSAGAETGITVDTGAGCWCLFGTFALDLKLSLESGERGAAPEAATDPADPRAWFSPEILRFSLPPPGALIGAAAAAAAAAAAVGRAAAKRRSTEIRVMGVSDDAPLGDVDPEPGCEEEGEAPSPTLTLPGLLF
jgi:hypothetical protein